MEPQEKEVAVSFVRRIPLVEHTCPVCRTIFQAPSLRVYCSLECKQKASWERNGSEFNDRRKQKREVGQQRKRAKDEKA
jgi:hypothetical protein